MRHAAPRSYLDCGGAQGPRAGRAAACLLCLPACRPALLYRVPACTEGPNVVDTFYAWASSKTQAAEEWRGKFGPERKNINEKATTEMA